MKRIIPYILILIGLLLLFFVGQEILAGVCFLIGIVVLLERIWPEKWGSDGENAI